MESHDVDDIRNRTYPLNGPRISALFSARAEYAIKSGACET